MGCWVGISNRRKWWSTAEPKMSGGATFRLSKYMSRTRFEGILGSLNYTDKRMLNILMGYHACVKWNKHGTLILLKSLTHHGLMFWKKLLWIGLTNIHPDLCVLVINLILSVMKDTIFVLVQRIFCGYLR